MSAPKQIQNAFRVRSDITAPPSGQQAQVRIATHGDADAISPARQYQAWLEQAWDEQPQERFSLGARAAIIVGGSAALWAAIAWLIYLALR